MRSVADLAEFLGGTILGDGSAVLTAVASIEEAGPGSVTFAENERHFARAEASPAACVIVPRGFESESKTLIQVEDPRFAFAKVLHLYAPPLPVTRGIHATAVVAPDARLGEDVALGPHAVVESGATIGAGTVIFAGVYVGAGARIGENCIFHPHASVLHGCEVGANAIVHACAVIGSDGFGFVTKGGKHYKVPQVGRVVVEENCEIGAGTCIDRAVTGVTLVKAGTKIDNLVHIGHNCVIGHDCLIVAQVGLSGSTKLGDRVTLAGQVGVAGHLEIGENTVVGAQSGVTKSLPPNVYVSGYPARPHSEERKIKVSLGKLPETIKKVNQVAHALKRIARRIERLEIGSRVEAGPR